MAATESHYDDDIKRQMDEIIERLKHVEPWSIEEKNLINELFDLEDVAWQRRMGGK